MCFYKKRVVPIDTPADVAERVRFREAAAQVNAERNQRWPTVTAENFEEIATWQTARIAEIMQTA